MNCGKKIVYFAKFDSVRQKNCVNLFLYNIKGGKNMEKEKKSFYKKWWFWVVVAIVVIGVVGSSSNTTTVSSNPNLTSNETSTPAQTTEKQANVGDVVDTNEVKISYLSSQDYTNYNSYSTPKEGNKVVRAEFEFENISSGDVSLNSFECYADGEKCEEYYYADDYKSPTLESLSKGKKVKAIVYYEVPKTATEVVLEYETSYWTNEKIEFIIK